MKSKQALFIGAFWGALSSLPVMAMLSLGLTFFSYSFAPYDLFELAARMLPGGLVTFGIDLLVGALSALRIGPTDVAAKYAELGMAILSFILIGTFFGFLLGFRSRSETATLIRTSVIGSLVMALIFLLVRLALGYSLFESIGGLVWFALTFLAWGAGLGWLIQNSLILRSEDPSADLSRRQFLTLAGGGIAGITLGALGLNSLVQRRETQAPVSAEPTRPVALDPADTSGPANSPPQEILEARIDPAPGTRSELTSTEDFYRIDINTIPRRVDPTGWELEVSGLVATPLNLSLAELQAYPPTTQAITLSCISNQVGGDLIGTSFWTGVPLQAVLEDAGVMPAAQAILIESADGFFETVSLQDAADPRTLLVYEMNEEPLTPEHGAPLRIYIPNRFGMKQPKWISRMELLPEDRDGYWVSRGWSKQAYAQTTSVIDTVNPDAIDPETGILPIGGIAWAGERGISKVELQIDEESWQEVELRSPPLSPLTWVQWRHDWEAIPGSHTFRVRATENDGKLQTESSQGARPSGATGIHEVRVRI